MNKNLLLFIFLLSLALMGTGVIWGVVVYFENWHQVMSDYDKFGLCKFPMLFFFSGYILQKIGEMFEKK